MRVDHDHPSNMERSWDLYRDEIWAGPCVPPVALRYVDEEPAESSRATKGHCLCTVHQCPGTPGPFGKWPSCMRDARGAKTRGPLLTLVASLACVVTLSLIGSKNRVPLH